MISKKEKDMREKLKGKPNKIIFKIQDASVDVERNDCIGLGEYIVPTNNPKENYDVVYQVKDGVTRQEIQKLVNELNDKITTVYIKKEKIIA